jgi:hypothetical protein
VPVESFFTAILTKFESGRKSFSGQQCSATIDPPVSKSDQRTFFNLKDDDHYISVRLLKNDGFFSALWRNKKSGEACDFAILNRQPILEEQRGKCRVNQCG